MKIRGHGNGLAIALSGLAVVFAASGTAYAVTATTVNIADPSTPSRVARVDTSGRLSTVGPTSTLNVASIVFANSSGSGDLFSAPTLATLAVSKFSVTALSPGSGVYKVYLFQVPVVADGTCSLNAVSRTLGYGSLAAGALGGQDFAAPIVVAPIAGAKYCLDLYLSLASGTTAGESFGMQITGFVASGKYTPAATPAGTSDGSQPKTAAVAGR